MVAKRHRKVCDFVLFVKPVCKKSLRDLRGAWVAVVPPGPPPAPRAGRARVGSARRCAHRGQSPCRGTPGVWPPSARPDLHATQVAVFPCLLLPTWTAVILARGAGPGVRRLVPR